MPQWNRERLSCRNGRGKMSSMTFGMHFHLTQAPRPRTHDTKRFPGYGGGCLKANSLAQPRLVTFFFWQIVFTILGGGHCVLRYVALHHSPCLAESQRVSCLRKGRLRRGMPSRLRSRHQIATMCEAASMTRGNLNDVYAPMMFLHSYTW
jgi:hypothetical protein